MSIGQASPAFSPAVAAPPVGTRNHLLSAVATMAPELVGQFEPVDFRSGQIIANADEPLAHAYFPETAVISLITVMQDGSVMEAAAIGNEGLVGLSLALGGSWTGRSAHNRTGPGPRGPRPGNANSGPHSCVIHSCMRASCTTPRHCCRRRCSRGAAPNCTP